MSTFRDVVTLQQVDEIEVTLSTDTQDKGKFLLGVSGTKKNPNGTKGSGIVLSLAQLVALTNTLIGEVVRRSREGKE